MIPFRIYNGFFDDKNQSTKYESIEVFVQLSFSKKKVPDLKNFFGFVILIRIGAYKRIQSLSTVMIDYIFQLCTIF